MTNVRPRKADVDGDEVERPTPMHPPLLEDGLTGPWRVSESHASPRADQNVSSVAGGTNACSAMEPRTRTSSCDTNGSLLVSAPRRSATSPPAGTAEEPGGGVGRGLVR
jgi:hypothetical protein